ncbi:MAG: hypothetical protein KF862_14455 [Chitinophagaceae bacterium]|nr:hypothetical protein [Chitinophagaceae bacterium]
MIQKQVLNRRKFVKGISSAMAAFTFVPTPASAGWFRHLLSFSRNQPGSLPVFWIIPHTHWEGAVFTTREKYLDIGLPHILTALKLLKQYPEYRFTLDQVCYIRPFLERYPEERNWFKQCVAENRLQLVGGTDTMHDTNIPSGESIIKQIQYGKGYIRKQLGKEVTVGWGIDTFGHNAQMPQILKLAGFTSLWFHRAVPYAKFNSEFLWKGIDGTTIDAYWLPLSYVPLYDVPGDSKGFSRFVKEKFDRLGEYTNNTGDRVGLAGHDVSNPREQLPVLVRQYQDDSKRELDLYFGVPTDFENAAEKNADRVVWQGEFNPVFQGVYTSRIELKQQLRAIENLLLTADKLHALTHPAGADDRSKKVNEELWRAWEPVLFNQAHDLMSGVMTDTVYEDTLKGYHYAGQVAGQLISSLFEELVAHIDTEALHIPLVIFNSLGWQRTDVVETEVGFATDDVTGIIVENEKGISLPFEIIAAEYYESGGINRAKIIFIATDIPALGYAVYQVKPGKKEPLTDTGSFQSNVIENDFYKCTFNMRSGAITELLAKENNWQVLKAPGNVVVRQYDGGDFWEINHTIRYPTVALTNKQEYPHPDKDRFSNEGQYFGKEGHIHHGAVYSEYKINHGFGDDNKFSTSVRMYRNGIRRIDIKTQLFNAEKYVRYQALFPLNINDGKTTHEIPFGAITRPDAVEYPAQNWAHFGNDDKGVALLNKGLPGNLAIGSSMLVSLMRSAKINSYPFFGGYEEGMDSVTGLQLNKQLSFEYALVPHVGSWQDASVYKEGFEFNAPLLCIKTDRHKGKLLRRWGLLELSHPNVVITSVRKNERGAVIIRMYEAAGKAEEHVSLKLNLKPRSVSACNLMEDEQETVVSKNGMFQFSIKPFEIKTFSIRF